MENILFIIAALVGLGILAVVCIGSFWLIKFLRLVYKMIMDDLETEEDKK